uniref:Uncharacterized protein n=1 Tax=Rhizophora mucronata TaxID=61149 RepID=A0A2P2PDN5_RHIMU
MDFYLPTLSLVHQWMLEEFLMRW